MGIRFDIDPVAQMEASSLLASWLQLPTETLQESVSDGSFVASVAALAEALEESQGAVEGDGSWQDALDAVRSGQPSSLEDLRRDYTRLFTHPRKPLIPPY